MKSQLEIKREIKCMVNKGSLKALALSQLALAIILALFTTIIDPPPLINIIVAASVTAIEGASVGYVLHYLRHGCFT
ncbi:MULTISPECIES: hypothetical protein [Vulcanisaeta]|uniref:Uncharacterized protein n=2 Tax=Vulcanisaeta TaxID=164450 RepID=E1QSF2_VULDI|nr:MULTISPECIES: hypothetical protein [Vulcanisaeta]ADN50745.1 hypothetical protein Vdis_1359 [Vulcanisaeta distributa DSM 14429]BDR91484.1 hypothetical protein Vsou_05770 [Vulcanisaeta souniana JCM 11219]GGI73493.1 hypothetical protein GCM10007112_07960 [Vulcanisaeta souniana JCM 11219]